MAGKLSAILIAVLHLTGFSLIYSGEALTTEEILQQIVKRARHNEELIEQIGFEQITTSKKFNGAKVADMKIRKYRMTWIQNEPYLELIEVNGAELTDKDRKEERKRKAEFIKSLREKKEDPEDITWEEMYSKYDFERLPADSTGHFVFSFKPKAGKLSQRSRAEKVLNHITGTLWADEEFNLVQIEARLLDNVRFGLGILGTIEKLELKYKQHSFRQMQVPSYFFVHYKARLALVKVEERKIESTYSDFFQRNSERAK